MNTLRIAPFVVALALNAPARVVAQEPEPPVGPGDRVRVTAPDVFREPLVGNVVALSGDTCVVRHLGHAQVAVPLALVTGLEVSRGKSNVAKGAGLGLLIGGAAGALLGLSCRGEISTGQCVVILGGVGAGAGLLIGAALGAISGGERWEAVPLEHLSVVMVPHHDGGSAIRVSLRL